MLCNSPIEFIDTLYNNNIYIKREDKLPFSFGGNKVRFAKAFLEDMHQKGKNAIIAYGSKSSNLCRVMAQMCFDNKIPCAVVYSGNEEENTYNSKIVSSLSVREYACDKTSVAQTVQRAIDDFNKDGFDPYYIYGNTKGEGNELTPVNSYKPVFDEIKKYETNNNKTFDYIFLATGTAATYSGLLIRASELESDTKIIGISVARDKEKCTSVIKNNLDSYFGTSKIADINITDEYLFSGYGKTCAEELKVIDFIYDNFNIPLDPTYTGKAFYGMKEYLNKNDINNKNILFIHTGGYPLFCDYKGLPLQGETI